MASQHSILATVSSLSSKTQYTQDMRFRFYSSRLRFVAHEWFCNGLTPQGCCVSFFATLSDASSLRNPESAASALGRFLPYVVNTAVAF
ncbi:hypothetical protein PPTG_23898 [Phytophthora nicotianae INRA-310]|uniref:Uncharacterized protein n=1 Tax=Phytophthora nicotianae (strain INRA-310) TaxID=761204 RepID=W2PPL8_PHYN3|nr:hypothetical protein PPTG_23898 [Phytophthora nicotianae INRA-310]ETN02797.1 hypothetical protein PPTG_23898 [Phytophthora nicotianae INRA-310]